ncbi:MAG: hypothetical protein ACOX7J_04090 [Bacillota bacterium]|jgi:cytosine/uracil/thiamine/allantoin permease
MYYNLGSLLLGVLALILPFAAIARHNKGKLKSNYLFSIISFACCLAALCLQFADFSRLIKIEDWSAIIDTAAALQWIAVILSFATVILNCMALAVCRKDC